MPIAILYIFSALNLAPPDDPRPELGPFLGSWELIEAIQNGKPREVETGEQAIVYVFQPDGTYTGQIG
ncbi:MAG: lipocalin family protein, partial [Isosphaeraceae bacterium]